jgi:hypothetical protein
MNSAKESRENFMVTLISLLMLVLIIAVQIKVTASSLSVDLIL